MNVIQSSKFGPPSILQLRTDYPKPTCNSKEVLIKTHAASVNPADIAIRAGQLMGALTKKPNVCENSAVQYLDAWKHRG